MTEAVDAALLAMQAALFGAEVYAPDHPAVGAQRQRAVRMLGEVLMHRDQVALIVFDDRVVFDNAPLPSSAKLVGGMFERLRRRGVEALTILRGVSDGEVAGLLSQLPEKPETGAGLKPSAHVKFAFIEGAGVGRDEGTGGRLLMGSDLRRRASALQGVWSDLYKAGDCSPDVLGSVVADICTTVSVSGGTMLPLAALKNFDEYTFIHTINVAILSSALAEAVGLRADQTHDITLAALMHDVGKRRVPKRLLRKQAALTDSEFAVMQRHPLEGARLLLGAPNIPEVAAIVAYEHHIHLNGAGYPHVKPGWQTSFASQIVQVADVFDALRTNRPYRDALSLEKSMQIMLEGRGVKYDATLLEVFFERVAQQTDRELPDGCGVPGVVSG